MCSGSEAGSYLRLVGLVYDSTLGLRVIKKKKKKYLDQGEVDLLLNHSRMAPEPLEL